MPDDILVSKLAVEKMIATAKGKATGEAIPGALTAAGNLAIILGVFNKTLRKQHVEKALRHKLVLSFQQILIDGGN